MFCFSLKINSKNEINRDLKLALTSSNNDTQTIYNQLRQLNTNLSDLQQKYDEGIAERNSQIEILRTEQKQIIVNLQQKTPFFLINRSFFFRFRQITMQNY